MVNKYKGGVYIIQYPNMWNTYKIGYTNNLQRRMKELNNEAVLYPPKLLNFFYCKNPRRLEKLSHQKLKNYRVCDNKEFFKGQLSFFQNTIREQQMEINK